MSQKKRYAFLVDMEKCIGCRACAMACKNFNQLSPEMVWRYVYPLSTEIYPYSDRAFLSLACNHCSNPACYRVCPTHSYSIRPDGIVVQNDETCIGCRDCMRACPYGAPRYNQDLKVVQKCSMCYDRIDADLKPACVKGCLTNALSLIDLDTYQNEQAVQFPAGYPQNTSINPSTRFLLPKVPRVVKEI